MRIGGVYKYNGISGTGTSLVMGINYNQYSTVPISHIGSKAYYVLYNTNYVPQLWWANGPSGSPIKIADLPAGAPVTHLTNCGNLMYFNVSTNNKANEVWRSDGTDSNTYLLRDINPGTLSSNANWFTANKNKTFFAATTLANGTELWASDGTTNNTYLVKDINTHSTEGSNPGDLTPFNNKIIFEAATPDKGVEPYVSNGTNAGTFMLKDIIKGEESSWPSNFQVKGSYVYFLSSQVRNVIYRTSGTKSNTSVFYDFGPFVEIYNYAVADNNVLFLILRNLYNGYYELWRTDGTSTGTFSLASTINYPVGSLLTMNNNVYLPWSDLNASKGTELWESDGSVVGTKIIKDILKGAGSSSPHDLYVYNNTLYFGAFNGTEDGLWKTDGTTLGTKKIKTLYAGSFHATDSMLFFAGNVASSGSELWKTDGTAPGTVKVKDILPGASSSNPSLFNNIGNTLFFMANDSVHGMQLWKSDGTGSGTQLLSQLYFTYPNTGNFAVAGNQLYFMYFDTLNARYSLAVSDGTKAGTLVVEDSLVKALDISAIAGAGDELFLVGNDYRYGAELYEGKVSASAKSTPLYSMSEVHPQNDIHAQIGNNPFRDQLNMNIYSKATEKVKIQVTNIAGTVYYDNSINLSTGVTTQNIDTGTWANGIYIIHIFNPERKEQEITLKVIKAR